MFTVPELRFEFINNLLTFSGSVIECGEWIESLPEDLKPYAVDAVYKANEQLNGQRATEANRQIFIFTLLNELMATAHEHLANDVKDSALLRAMK